MTLYDDFLFNNRHRMDPELPDDCNQIAEEICLGDFASGMEICEPSLIMFLEKMNDRIRDLEAEIQFLKAEM